MMVNMKTRIVGRGVVYHAGKILLVQQQRLTGVWVVPGGGWEEQYETITQCVERECMEEVGLQVKVIVPLYFDDNKKNEKNYVALYYLAFANSDKETVLDITKDEDILDAKWVDREGIQAIDEVWPREIRTDKFWDIDLPHILEVYKDEQTVGR